MGREGSMRQSLVRIGVFTTLILIFFLGWTTIPELDRAREFDAAQAAITQLPQAERLRVIDRIAWLNGSASMPSVPRFIGTDLNQQLRNETEIANARLAAARPLPFELENLARNANRGPQWDVIRWRIGMFAGAITLLWGVLLLWFWISSARRPSQQGL
jgi:hypothetical protein